MSILKREIHTFNLNAIKVLVLLKHLEMLWNLELLNTVKNILQLWIPQGKVPFKN